MIFITIGTHEQQFNRLIQEIDILKGKEVIKDEIFIQTGFSTYEPKNCEWKNLITYKEMNEKLCEARIVITHGGPASFIAALKMGKIPIVVPRQAKFQEHINDHQLEFVQNVEVRNKNIIPVYDIKDLEDRINNYDKIIKKIDKNSVSNNDYFCREFEKKIKEMIGE